MNTTKDLPAFLKYLESWESFISSKHVLFDTDALINIVKFKAWDIFDVFESVKATRTYIHPVGVELLNTNNNEERVLRQSILIKYDFEKLDLVASDFNNASKIQLFYATNQRIYPKPTDLYNAGKLASFKHNKVILCTRNVKDYPHPLFERRSGLILQNNLDRVLISLLELNLKFLKDEVLKL